MHEFSSGVWILLAAVGAGATIAWLYAAAAFIRNHSERHTVLCEVRRLREEYRRRSRAAANGGVDPDEEVIEVDEAPDTRQAA